MHLSNLGRTLRGGNPPNIIYPTGTVVPYFGTTPTLAGWSRWAGADNDFCLFGTASGTGARTSVSGSGIRHFSIPGGSAGSHTVGIGSIYVSNIGTSSGGQVADPTANSVGQHSHVASNYSVYASSLRPRRAQFNFLQATAPQTELPGLAMVFSQNLVSNTVEFTDSSTTYITSGGTTATPGSINLGVQGQLQVTTSGSAGGHTHQQTVNSRLFFNAVGSSGRDVFVAGAHNHTAQITITQPTFGPTVILRLFRALSNLPPTSNIIVGYIGNPNAIPFPWFLCNGQNGTIDLRDRFVAINSTISAGTNLAGPTYEGINRTTTTGSQNISHSHGGTQRYGNTGQAAGHLTGNWAHSHGTITYNFDGTPITAAKVSIQFIQYKG